MSSEFTTLRQLLRQSDRRIDRMECELLLAHALNQNRAWIWAHLDDPVSSERSLDRFLEWVAQRAEGQPIAYLTGCREFYGREFAVNPNVLIPRPETELLVDLALSHFDNETIKALDVGTGSGAIALTLAAERPDWTVQATDISSEALAVARENRDRLGLSAVKLIQSDLLNQLDQQRFDLIISNPPYVAEGDPHLDQGDLRFEPAIALSCDEDGLGIIARLISQAQNRLQDQGWLLIEHGYQQAASVRRLLQAAGLEQVQSWKDLARIERVSGGRRRLNS